MSKADLLTIQGKELWNRSEFSGAVGSRKGEFEGSAPFHIYPRDAYSVWQPIVTGLLVTIIGEWCQPAALGEMWREPLKKSNIVSVMCFRGLADRSWMELSLKRADWAIIARIRKLSGKLCRDGLHRNVEFFTVKQAAKHAGTTGKRTMIEENCLNWQRVEIHWLTTSARGVWRSDGSWMFWSNLPRIRNWS